MAISLKDKLQYKALTWLCDWVEDNTCDRSPEDMIAFSENCGRLIKLFNCLSKNKMIKLLKKVLPERDDHEKIYDTLYVTTTGRLLPDALMAMNSASAEIFPYEFEYENMDLLKEKVAEGKGVVMVSGHFGNWEVYLQSVAWAGVAMTALQRQHSNELIHQLITDKRHSNGIETIDFHRRRPQSVMDILRALKQGKVVGFMVDVVPKTASVEVPFMGKKFLAPLGPALMAYRTGAPVVPGFAIRTENGYKTIMGPEVLWPNGECTKENVPAMTAKIMMSLENMIRKYPDHWLWYMRRYSEMPFNI